ncbi:MAG: CotH kinase family protein, partial [Chitinispirillaceae bacterium]|nr:CotH kinase family protein [Chitinispirillaceae bacterium]
MNRRLPVTVLLPSLSCLLGCALVAPYDAPEPGPSIGSIRLFMSNEAMAFIDSTPQPLESRSQEFVIAAETVYTGSTRRHEPVRMNLHGESSLTFFRKSLELKIPAKERLFSCPVKLDDCFLIAMSPDYGYFCNVLGLSTLRRCGLFFSHFEYVRGYINGTYRGLYLFMQKTQEALKAKPEAPIAVFRRNYGPTFELKYLRTGYEDLLETLIDRLMGLYRAVGALSGAPLLAEMERTLDFDGYCRWLGVNMLLKNGDYLDEVFFYAVMQDGEIVFRVCGWDYEDIFQPPHGGAAVPGSLVYSSEDALDSAIATDPVLYACYGENFGDLLENELAPPFFTALQDSITAKL